MKIKILFQAILFALTHWCVPLIAQNDSHYRHFKYDSQGKPIYGLNSGIKIGNSLFYHPFSPIDSQRIGNQGMFKYDLITRGKVLIDTNVSRISNTKDSQLAFFERFSGSVFKFYYTNTTTQSPGAYVFYNHHTNSSKFVGLASSNGLPSGIQHKFYTSFSNDAFNLGRKFYWGLRKEFFTTNLYIFRTDRFGNFQVDSVFKPNFNEFDNLFGDSVFSSNANDIGVSYPKYTVLLPDSTVIFSHTYPNFSHIFKIGLKDRSFLRRQIFAKSNDSIQKDTLLTIKSHRDCGLGFQWLLLLDSTSFYTVRNTRWYVAKVRNQDLKIDTIIRLKNYEGNYTIQAETFTFVDSSGCFWFGSNSTRNSKIYSISPKMKLRAYDSAGILQRRDRTYMIDIDDMGKRVYSYINDQGFTILSEMLSRIGLPQANLKRGRAVAGGWAGRVDTLAACPGAPLVVLDSSETIGLGWMQTRVWVERISPRPFGAGPAGRFLLQEASLPAGQPISAIKTLRFALPEVRPGSIEGLYRIFMSAKDYL